MRGIEVEESGGYFVRDDDDDDDENVDPDRDFSYIDRKLEFFLGHYQKDFMRKFSAECLGPMFGGYGSFLPVKERSPPILSNQRSQSRVSSKSTPNLPSENPSVAANTSVPATTVSVLSTQSMQFQPESGISIVNNQLEVKNSAKCSSNHHEQSKKSLLHQSEPKSLDFKVKKASEIVSSWDKAAIYSGLGLDMSPYSSPEGTPSQNDGTLLGLQEMNVESPSFIVKIMTTIPFPNEVLMSPLHDDLICLIELENTVQTGLQGIGQVEPVSIIHHGAYFDGNRVSVQNIPKLMETRMENNLVQKEAIKEMKPSQITKRQKPAEVVKGDDNKRNAIKITRTLGKDESVTLIPKDEPGTEKRNEFGPREDELDQFLKQHSLVKDIVKDDDSDSLYPKEVDGYRKESGKHEKIAKDEDVGVVSEKDAKDNKKQYDIPPKIKQDESLSSKQKSSAKAMARLQVCPSLKEPTSSLVKKKFVDVPTAKVSFTEPPRGRAVGSSGGEYEEVSRNIVPFRSKRGDIDLPKEIRKDCKVDVMGNLHKKEKDLSSRGVVMGATERRPQHSASQMKEQGVSKKTGIAIYGPNLEGDMSGVNLNERLPPENAVLVPLEMDDWVQCEKCQKWRLLPFGKNPDSLPKEWVCSMLSWLPGMNRCSVSQDETTHALQALYLPSASGPSLQMQNVQQAQLGGIAFVKPLAGNQNIGCSNLAPTADVMLNRGKKQENHHRPIKKNPQHSDRIRSVKNPKRNLQELTSSSKNAENSSRPLKIPKKRIAEAEVSGVPKKIKKAHQLSVVSSGHAGLSSPLTKGQNQNRHRNSQGFVHGSSECPPLKVKIRGQSAVVAMDGEVNDGSEKRRKLKDQRPSANATKPFDDGQRPPDNLVTGKNNGTDCRQERKTTALNIEARDTYHASRVGSPTLAPSLPCRPGRAQKISDTRKSSEKARDFGLSDDATTSSSSKASTKVKVKAFEVTRSPAGSNSASPLKNCKSKLDKGSDAVVFSYNALEELSSRKQLKSREEGTCASIEVAPHAEETKDRKFNLCSTAGLISDTSRQFSKKGSFEKSSDAHRVGDLPKLEDSECHDSKLDRVHLVERTLASQWNSESRNSTGLNCGRTSLDRPKLHAANVGDEFAPEFEKGSGSNSVRHLQHTSHAFKDAEASSSKRKGSVHWAVTALKEARDLKHSANRLKTAGSGISTGLFFQAALKFLHGASLLESENKENGRIGDMSSTEVYSSTAKLCEYSAHEFEKCNDMGSAALAYKCMEVAYMRVVYNNDVAMGRDRVELQMAVRATPQEESPSSSASDIDNLNNHMAIDSARDGHSVTDHQNHVISAGNRPNFVRLLSFTHDINLAMEASRKSHDAFAIASPTLSQAGNAEGISSIRRVLDFNFHDVDRLLHLVRLAMEALNN